MEDFLNCPKVIQEVEESYDEDKCKNCGMKRIEHAESPNYDSKALTNKCKEFVFSEESAP